MIFAFKVTLYITTLFVILELVKRFKLLGSIVVCAVVFSLVFVPPVQAQSQNSNSILNTLKILLQQIIGPIEKRLSLVEDRTESLEVWTQNHQDQPQCATCTAEIAVKAVNEEEAIESLQSIYLAQAKFQKEDTDQDGKFDYAPRMDLLFESGRLIDNVLGTGEKRGYVFELNTNQNLGWYVKATPKKPNRTGDRSFFVDETGVIRASDSASVSSDSPALDN